MMRINTSYWMISTGLLMILALSAMLHFGVKSWLVYLLLVLSFMAVGAGILLGFIGMVSSEKMLADDKSPDTGTNRGPDASPSPNTGPNTGLDAGEPEK
ncbi:MAG TPA: hypothetical protein ENJ64_03105 [Thiotrichales bacterium]|nr:hypothetical protein [Thiotrichales bacterium]